MSEELILRHCAPTLAGLKTGSLFSYIYENKDELYESIRQLNQKIVPKGLRIIPLAVDEKRALIYLFRPNMLKNDLSDSRANALLMEYGYNVERSESCVSHLCKRMAVCREFPHEIGFFLGYPVEDVIGFIENKAGCCKCVGYWKVYGDEEKAKRIFEKYNKCTAVYCSQWRKGKSIERLVVAD